MATSTTQNKHPILYICLVWISCEVNNFLVGLYSIILNWHENLQFIHFLHRNLSFPTSENDQILLSHLFLDFEKNAVVWHFIFSSFSDIWEGGVKEKIARIFHECSDFLETSKLFSKSSNLDLAISKIKCRNQPTKHAITLFWYNQ